MIAAAGRQSDVRRQIASIASILVVSTSIAAAAEPSPRWNDFPVAAFMLVAPLDRLERDLGFLSEETGRAITALRDAVAIAIDPTRPAGVAVLVDEGFVPIVFAPIKDPELLLRFLHDRYGWRFHRGDDGVYRGDDLPVAARVSGPWMYFTAPDHREHLANLPEDPSAIGPGSDRDTLAQLNVMVEDIPIEHRAAFAMLVREWFPAATTAITVAGFEHVLTESEACQISLQYCRPREQFHLSGRMTPIAGSDMERKFAKAARRPVLMDHLATSDALAVTMVSAVLEGVPLNLWKSVWDGINAAARPRLPSLQSEDVGERRMAAFGMTVLDTMTAHVATGTIDVGVALHEQGDELVLLAGTSLTGSRKIENAAADLFDALNSVPGFQALQWATGASGDVTVHEFQLPTDDTTRWMFGKTMHIAVGFGHDRVYGAIGGQSAIEQLSLAVDRSREGPPSRGGSVHVSLRAAPILALIDRAPGNDTASNAGVHKLAEIIVSHRKNDVMGFDLKAVDHAMEGCLRIDAGVVRTLLAAAGDSGPPKPEQKVGISPQKRD
jgi:hypothetical protein